MASRVSLLFRHSLAGSLETQVRWVCIDASELDQTGHWKIHYRGWRGSPSSGDMRVPLCLRREDAAVLTAGWVGAAGLK